MSRKRIIVALDVETAAEAREIITELRDEVGAFKIGLQLFTSAGSSFVRELTESGVKIFLDAKFHDIPNTVAKAAIEATRLGVWMFDIHALGGGEMMLRTVENVEEVCVRENLKKPKIIGITVLTSSDQETLNQIGIEKEINSQVLNLAQISAKYGLDGVVASPFETQLIRREIGGDFLIVTPGIRAKLETNDDQKRVMTAKAAVENGSDYLVIGRPILNAADRLAAVKQIFD